MRAFIERCGFVGRANDYMLKRKVGAGVVAVRRAGGIPAFSSLFLFLHYMQMIIPGASYWSVGIGRDIGEVHQDVEGVETMRSLGPEYGLVTETTLSLNTVEGGYHENDTRSSGDVGEGSCTARGGNGHR